MTIVRIERLANGGDAVAHLPDGRVVFVPRAVPGDEVEVELTRAKKRWARGEVVKVLTPSPARQPAGCEHFDECGGCAFQHVVYEDEVRFKIEAALDAFQRISGLVAPDGERVVGPSEGYRVRARFHADGTTLGYHAAESHDLFELQSCPVLDPRISAILSGLRDAVGGRWGEVAVEVAGAGEVVVTLDGHFDETAARRVAGLRGVRGVEVVGRNIVVGEPTIDAVLALGVDADVEIDAGRFRQSNGPLTDPLRALVARRLKSGSRLVEYYAGSGSLTFAVADAFEAVEAYEVDKRAIDVAHRVARARGQAHVKFTVADLDTDVPIPSAPASVLLDPPRTGARAVAEAIAHSGAPQIVYVACDVATLARDAKILAEGGYRLDTLDFVDMFPRTPHIEVVATFSIND